MLKENNSDWISGEIIAYTAGSTENNLGNNSGEKSWDTPITGFSRGDDPLYASFKTIIGDFHWTPEEIFNLTFPGANLGGEALTVICWVLPQMPAAKKDNRREKHRAAERWVRSRFFGEAFNRKLHLHVTEFLTRAGYRTAAPMCSPLFKIPRVEPHGFASPWSLRHAAYVSGLGTFGLCDGLITPLGKAVRLGAVVTEAVFEPTARPYQGFRDYCLFYKDKSCVACIKRCPADAVNEKGHDKIKCRSHCHTSARDFEDRFGVKQSACGLCQTAVPCESGVPPKARPNAG